MGDGDGQSSHWRFLVDENLDPTIVEELSEHDIDAEYVVDALFEGADDFETCEGGARTSGRNSADPGEGATPRGSNTTTAVSSQGVPGGTEGPNSGVREDR